MSRPKMTPWFPPSVKPAKHGTYQTNDCVQDCALPRQGFQNWNGRFWGVFNLSADEAASESNYRSSFQNNYWRGLQSDPKAKTKGAKT